jgi:hypothetical protein
MSTERSLIEPCPENLRRLRQPRGGADLEQVEAVVPAREAAVPEIAPEVGLEAAQHDVLAGLELGHDLGPLAGRELHAVGLVRPLEQAGVAGHLLERAVVGEAEVVDPCVRGVEQTEPHPLGGDVQVGVHGAVHDDGVAQEADGVEQRLAAVELAVAVERAVLHDQRHVVDPVGGRQVGSRGGVVDEE